MKPVKKTFDIIEKKQIKPCYGLLKLYAPELAAGAKPGQFLHVKCSGTMDPLLRRPISIHAVQRSGKTISMLYRKAGRGTSMLDSLDKLDVMGPLGHGFNMSCSGTPLVVGGGIGAAPLYFLLQELSGMQMQVDVFIGASSSEHLLAVEDIKALGHCVRTATDDGSAGYRGPVTDTCLPYLNKDVQVFACGPVPMLKKLAGDMEENKAAGQFSLEEKMGCGVGACLSCVCKTYQEKEKEYTYSRVCVDGPVFSAGEVVWK
ncbi:MAG: dihydroorotate dehydrogenase electron transfer subunit [Clostridiales bacterium]|nr:dihydroorotate dehydrogenase electron transfer subunit [Clostridiales bacterium]MCF8022750.1 dihydroorotate dehydrogenase electron transfer subunit [Clostridiales bacterium]